jgi:hypothetical protein
MLAATDRRRSSMHEGVPIDQRPQAGDGAGVGALLPLSASQAKSCSYSGTASHPRAPPLYLNEHYRGTTSSYLDACELSKPILAKTLSRYA